MNRSESTRELLIEDKDCDICLWLNDHPAGTYILSDEKIKEILEWGIVYNPAGLKRRLGKLLKDRGYIKKPNTSPPTWEKSGWVAPIIESEQPQGILSRLLKAVQR